MTPQTRHDIKLTFSVFSMSNKFDVKKSFSFDGFVIKWLSQPHQR